MEPEGVAENEEFDEQAAAIADSLDGRRLDKRISAACRGSGNPAGLAWLAEGLALGPEQRVVDLGAGLGGPGAWLERHYGCRVTGVEPAAGAVEGATNLFGAPVVRSTADATPLRSDAFAAAMVLGVLSVVPDRCAVLGEARRLAAGLGVLEWCSTEAGSVEAGGSCFPTPYELDQAVARGGWSVIQATPLDLPVPATWGAEGSGLDDPPEAEQAVQAAIEARRLRVRLVIADRG